MKNKENKGKFIGFINKAGSLIKDKAPELLDVIASAATGNISGAIKEAGDLFDKAKKENPSLANEIDLLKLELDTRKLEFEQEFKMAELAYKDTDSSRDMNTSIQSNEKASWLAKNLAYILDIIIVCLFGVMLIMIFNTEVPEGNKEIFYSAFGMLGGGLFQVINFHRGSTVGSKSKEVQISDLMKRVIK